MFASSADAAVVVENDVVDAAVVVENVVVVVVAVVVSTCLFTK